MYNFDNLVVPGGSQLPAQLPPAPEQSLNFIFPSNMHLFVWSRHFKFDFQFFFICNCSWEDVISTSNLCNALLPWKLPFSIPTFDAQFSITCFPTYYLRMVFVFFTNFWRISLIMLHCRAVAGKCEINVQR